MEFFLLKSDQALWQEIHHFQGISPQKIRTWKFIQKIQIDC